MSKEARILIVDDEPSVREIVNRQLSARGYHCEEAHTGDDAVRMLSDEGFDLLLADIRMPGTGMVRGALW